MMLTTHNIERMAADLSRALTGRTFTVESHKKWPGRWEREEDHTFANCRLAGVTRRHPIATTPFEASDEVRWLRVSLSTGISLMVPTTIPTQDGLANPSIVVVSPMRVVISYSGLTRRFFRYTFIFDQPDTVPHLLSIGDLPTVEIPEHLAALSRR